jgi:hypothetical protein
MSPEIAEPPAPPDGWCLSSRADLDVLAGEDAAAPLIRASSSGDLKAIEQMLDQDIWAKILLQRSQFVHHQKRPQMDEKDVREVQALTALNLKRVILVAAKGRHRQVVAKLLRFASQHNVIWTEIIDYDIIETTIQSGYAEIFRYLATFAPEVVMFDLHYYGRPLDKAINKRHIKLTATILDLGGGRDYGAAP